MGFFSNLFKSKTQLKNKVIIEENKTIPIVKPIKQVYTVEFMLQEEINNSLLIKDEYKATLISDFNMLGKIDFGDDILSDEEVRSLGLKTRADVPRKVINVLTEKGLFFEKSPKETLKDIFCSARTKTTIKNNIEREINLKSDKYQVYVCTDERTCNWCKSENKKVYPINTDYIEIINNNCTCKYCRSVVIGYFDPSKYGLDK